MGMSLDETRRALALAASGLIPEGAMVAELGAQEFMPPLPPSALIASAREAGARLPAPVPSGELRMGRDLFAALGWRTISFDLVDGETVHRLDLNTEGVPGKFHGIADLTTNFGTTEHVFNQANCFRFMHDLTRPGGLLWHVVPASNYYGHGFFKYDPSLFFAIARANDYDVIDWTILDDPAEGKWRVPDYLFDLGAPPLTSATSDLWFVFRKRYDRPFAFPIDSPVEEFDRLMFALGRHEEPERLWLYGAGGMGRTLARRLSDIGITITGFIDSHRSGELDAWPVLSLDDYRLVERRPDDRLIIASSFAAEIKASLVARGIDWFFVFGGR